LPNELNNNDKHGQGCFSSFYAMFSQIRATFGKQYFTDSAILELAGQNNGTQERNSRLKLLQDRKI